MKSFNLKLYAVRGTSILCHFNAGEKKWAIDFLLYYFKNRDSLAFDLNHFEEGDKKEIIKFVRNKVHACLLDKIEMYKLFGRADLGYWKAYEDMFNNVKRRDNYYSLELDGNKYVLRATG